MSAGCRQVTSRLLRWLGVAGVTSLVTSKLVAFSGAGATLGDVAAVVAEAVAGVLLVSKPRSSAGPLALGCLGAVFGARALWVGPSSGAGAG